MAELNELLTLLKQYGPVVAVLLLIIYWDTRRIDKLLERNGEIYEKHIQNLWETQQRLINALIGPQQSSQDSPTMDELKKNATSITEGKSKALGEGAGK